MIVSIADVFDALRSNRPYREGLATSRIRSIMSEQGNPAFNQVLLRRFVNLMGLFPIGTIVRLNTEEVGVVTAEHPEDPFRPQVKILFDPQGEQIESAGPRQHLGARLARRVSAGGRRVGRSRFDRARSVDGAL